MRTQKALEDIVFKGFKIQFDSQSVRVSASTFIKQGFDSAGELSVPIQEAWAANTDDTSSVAVSETPWSDEVRSNTGGVLHGVVKHCPSPSDIKRSPDVGPDYSLSIPCASLDNRNMDVSVCQADGCGRVVAKEGVCARHLHVRAYMSSSLDAAPEALPPPLAMPDPSLRPRSEVVAAGLSTQRLNREKCREMCFLSGDDNTSTGTSASILPVEGSEHWGGLRGGCGDPFRDPQGRV